MPLEAVADLVERLVDRLDVADGDLDLEEENDECMAGDDKGSAVSTGSALAVGDEADSEPDSDDEPDADDEFDDHPALDLHMSEDEPIFPGARLNYLWAQSRGFVR